jgi:hypothetical protein
MPKTPKKKPKPPNLTDGNEDADRREAKQMRDKSDDMKCSFCGKTRTECPVLITGPSVAICGECVGLCADIIREHEIAAAKEQTGKPPEPIRVPVPPPVKTCHREERIKKLEVLTVALEERISALEYNE